MKLYIAFLLIPVMASAQVRPFLIDFGSNAGSIAAIVEYKALKSREVELRKELNTFLTKYSQRTVYLESAVLFVHKIDERIETTFDRYEAIKKNNESLYSLFSYTTKKDNRRKLEVIRKMIANIKAELKDQDRFNIIYGEKLNLYQNTMQSLTTISRLMDQIEDEIESKKLINRFLG